MSNYLMIIDKLAALRPTSIFAVGIITSIKSDQEGCIKMIREQGLDNYDMVSRIVGNDILKMIMQWDNGFLLAVVYNG